MMLGMLERAVRADPRKTAIVHGDLRVSYAELHEQALRCAGGLAALGIGEGNCVAVVLLNCPEFVVAFFACMALRAIFLPLNPQYTRDELLQFMVDGEVRAVIAAGQAVTPLRPSHIAVPRIAVGAAAAGAIPFAALLGTDTPAPERRGAFRGRALYLYTSGSTDTFKRVCCTQENLWFEAENFTRSTGQAAADTILCAVPLHHSYGFGNGLLDAAHAGATLVLERDSDTPYAARHEAMLALLSEEQVRVFLGVPFQYDVLAASSADVAAAFAGVHWCISSGDVLRRQTFEAFRARSAQPIRSLYGSTEAASIAMDTGPAAQVHFDDLGPPLANVTIEARGAAGEIWVKSPTLPPGGYDNRPELNPIVFQDGFYTTGDLGRIDARGHLVITGRKQSFFDVGGHKVDLAEVEEALLAHPQVREAAAVGVEAPHLGGVLKAVVAARETCREADILDHCRRRLAPFKVPRFVEFREALPRSPLGKVLRAELLDGAEWLVDVEPLREPPRGPRRRQTEWLAQHIQEQVAAILACEPSAVTRDLPFQSLGFNSLRTVELQERLSRLSGVALSITTLWNYPSIDAYANFLLDAMQGGSAPAAAAGDSLDDLPDEEIAALLARELDLGAEGP